MKKVLIINSVSLFPATMMSQNRALNQIFSLANSAGLVVDVLTFYKNDKQRKASDEGFKSKVNKFYNFPAINYNGNKLRKNISNLQFELKFYLFGLRKDVSKYSSNYYTRKITNLINKEKYDVVISHYWYGSFFLRRKLLSNPVKIIDIHALIEEDIALNDKGLFLTNNQSLEKRKLKTSLKYQKELFNYCDYLIPSSTNQVSILKDNYPDKKYFYCPNGQELENYKQKISQDYDTNTILFYGSLGGKPNIDAFDSFYNYVWPLIIEKQPETKLLILGNNPSEQIRKLQTENNITVTGFVEDVTDYISKTCCMVLPLNLAVGFRGRVIEVMASGVPVIGTHNALDTLGMTNEKNGLITDDYRKMADYAIKLMLDKPFRKQLSDNALKFVENYSVENTYGKLAEFITSL